MDATKMADSTSIVQFEVGIWDLKDKGGLGMRKRIDNLKHS